VHPAVPPQSLLLLAVVPLHGVTQQQLQLLREKALQVALVAQLLLQALLKALQPKQQQLQQQQQ
jgi:hypothetical protein